MSLFSSHKKTTVKSSATKIHHIASGFMRRVLHVTSIVASSVCSSCDFIYKVNRPDDWIGMDHLHESALQSQSEERGKEVAWNLAPKSCTSKCYNGRQELEALI